MKKLFSLILVLLPFLCRHVQAEESRSIKVGVSLALSGPLSSAGTAIKDGMLLANATTAVKDRVEFIFEDDGFVAKNTVSIIKKFIEVDKVNCLVVFGSSTSLAVAEIAERARIPLIAIALSEKISDGKHYVMRHLRPAKSENELIAREVKRRKYKSVAVVSAIQEAMLALKEYFIESAPTNIEIAEEFLPSETDFRSLASRIKAKNIDAVYILLFSPQISAFTKQLKQIGYGGEFFGAGQVAVQDEIDASQGAMEGTWFAAGDDRSAGAFYKEYQARFGGLPPSELALNGYDIAMILFAGSNTPDLNGYLHNLRDFTGALGTYSANSENGFNLPVILKTIKSGKIHAG